MFKTPATYNGSNQDFCIPAHRKAFHSEGRKPIAAILKRQEKHMRQVAREEFRADIQACRDLISQLELQLSQSRSEARKLAREEADSALRTANAQVWHVKDDLYELRRVVEAQNVRTEPTPAALPESPQSV
jgi:hypothetical protein